MAIYQLEQSKIQRLIDNEHLYDFNIFLQLLRKFHGYSKRLVYQETGITHDILRSLEYGIFQRAPKDAYLIILSGIYDVDYQLLKTKLDKFMSQNKNKPRPQYEKVQRLQTNKSV